MRQLSPSEFSHAYDTDEVLTERAFQNLKEARAILLGVSGRIASGKDTVAPRVLGSLGVENSQHIFFALALKSEASQIIEMIREAPTGAKHHPSLIGSVARAMTCPVHDAQFMVETLWDDVRNGVVKDAYDRTTSTRSALQYWGTECRRTQDENYWVKKSMALVIAELAEGSSVMVTDARFENEVDAILSAGGSVVRLHVSEEEQRRRLAKRDGLTPTVEALTHTSETSLDRYEAEGCFTVTVDTDKHDIDETVEIASAAVSVKDSDRKAVFS